MELATTLTTQTVRNAIREVGINPHYWYAVGWSEALKPGAVTAVTVWKQAIALYRATNGQLFALEDGLAPIGVLRSIREGCRAAPWPVPITAGNLMAVAA
jgi:hypothetical protein